MVQVYLPSGPAGQLANLFFYTAALVSDVLLIRLFLCLAYIWLLCCERGWLGGVLLDLA